MDHNEQIPQVGKAEAKGQQMKYRLKKFGCLSKVKLANAPNCQLYRVVFTLN